MQKLTQLHEIDSLIQDQPISFLFISSDTCSVCKALLPKVEQMLQRYPVIQSAYVKVDEMPAIVGRLSIFTVPILLLFVNGKEVIRESRFVRMEELESQVQKYVAFLEQG